MPLVILEALSTDADPDVRSGVGRKRKASTEIFERLATDPDASVRHSVACNAKAPAHVRKLLADDVYPHVALAARARLGAP